MSALAIQPLACLPDLTAVGRVLVAIENGMAPGPRLDRRVHEALGWETDSHQGQHMIRRPGAQHWQRMPAVSTDQRATAGVVPWQWGYMAGHYAGRGRAWCRYEGPTPPGRMPAYMEAISRSVAMALLIAGLHAHRHQLVLLGESPVHGPDAGFDCACGWTGPRDAMHQNERCPGCYRPLLTAEAVTP